MPSFPRLVLIVGLTLSLAGCTDPPDASHDPDDPDAAPWSFDETTLDCTFCFEPVVASFDQGFLVDDWGRRLTDVSRDATTRTWSPPRPDLGPSTVVAETYALEVEGRLFYAMLAHNGNGPLDEIMEGAPGNEVFLYTYEEGAWSQTAHFLPGRSFTDGYTIGDRPWLVANGPKIVLSWAVPTPGGIEMSWSEDGGATWSEARTILGPTERGVASPRLAVSDVGRIVAAQAPIIVSIPGLPETPGLIELKYSDDGGRTWTIAEGPGQVDAAASARNFLTGMTWSQDLGFVLTWASESGALYMSRSGEGRSWSAPTKLGTMASAGLQPWTEAVGSCLTVTTWAQDLTQGSVLTFLVVQDGEVVREVELARQGTPQTDFPHHAVWDQTAGIVWSDGSAHHLRIEELDGC